MPESPEQRDRRLKRWRHYGAIGSCRWMDIHLTAMMRLETGNPRVQEHAVEAQRAVERLRQALVDAAPS